MKIGQIDTDRQVFLVAELSANHSGSLQIAKDTIYAAKEAGADGVKLQTYTPEWMTIDCKREDFLIQGGTLWDGKNLYELYRWAMTPLEWHEELFQYARSLNLEVFSSPFGKEAVDFLEQFDPVAYKIASFEVTDYDLVRYAASKRRPMIVSTGIASLEEIEAIVEICRNEDVPLSLLKCTSAYPAPLDEINLLTIPNMRATFGVEVGFSDHTLSIEASIAAVALGARIVEKHFILSENLDSPDKAFSLTPKEFKALATAIRNVERMLGKVDYKPKKGREFARSLYVVKDIKRGEPFTLQNVRSIRPGFGLHPKYLSQVLGKRACKDLKRGDRLTWEVIGE